MEGHAASRGAGGDEMTAPEHQPVGAAIPGDEAARLRALESYGILDTPPEQAFDDLAVLASHICGTPIALVTLVDEARQWFKARVGVALPETPRETAFCAHAILDPDRILVVPDAAVDARFAANPLVTGDPNIRFYAGAPLVTGEGHALGTICVIDRAPRDLTPDQAVALRALSRQVVTQLELRRQIAERERTEAALREAEQSYRDFLESANDLIQIVSPEGRFLYVNRAWRGTLGYEEAELAWMRVFDVVHPDERAHCETYFERVLAGEDAGTVETTFVTRGGEPIYVEGRVSCRFEDGRPVSTRAIFRDITERRRAELALHELHARTRQAATRLEALLRGATEYAIIGTDLDGRITVFNVGAERMLGYRADEVVGRHTPSLFHDAEEVSARAAALGVPASEVMRAGARRGEPQTAIWTYVRKDGSRLRVALTVSAKRDEQGTLMGFVGIARDVTREKLVTEVAEDLVGLLEPQEIAECFLRRVRDALPQDATAAVILNDAESGTFRSSAAEGPDSASFTGNAYSLDILNRAARERLVERLEPLFFPDTAEAGEVWRSVARALPSISDARTFAVLPLAMRERLVGALVLTSQRPNVVDRSTIDLLRVLGHYLAGALHGALTVKQIEAANEQLRSLNKAKSDFVSIVSHEFRTPLTGIQGFSELIRDEDLDAAEIKDFAADINKDARRLNRLITDMLDLDRMESGRMTLHRERVDLSAIAAEAAALAAPQASRHTIRLELGADATLMGDRDKLTQVVTNLLSNAIKYSPDGGEVVVATRSEGGEVRLSVSDQGPGIPHEALEAIFERYARVESAANRHIQGTGLGLPIVRQIAELHGGRAWAESAPGEGSTFHVALPVTAPTRSE